MSPLTVLIQKEEPSSNWIDSDSATPMEGSSLPVGGKFVAQNQKKLAQRVIERVLLSRETYEQSPSSRSVNERGANRQIRTKLERTLGNSRNNHIVLQDLPLVSQELLDDSDFVDFAIDNGDRMGWPYPDHPNQPTFPDSSLDFPEGDGGSGRGGSADETLALLLPLLILLTTLLLLLLIFLVFLILLRRNRRIVLRDEGGPTNLDQEDELEGEGGLEGIEHRWLAGIEETTKVGYLRGKVWQTQYPPNSQPTDITLSQFLSIQEKGVSAWSFEPDYESNAALFVESRTEITFLADGIGMAPEEGGGCCVQSNLPLPKLNEVYYWECKMFEKPEATTVALGLATKPFPSFRLPGWNKYSVGYFSSDGFKSHSYPFTAQSYGPPLTEGDVLGVGYKPRTGTVFFTRNGKKLEDAYVGLNRHNLFPTVGANGACTVHVNFGQAGFVFIEANVKKWGLAPMMGTLAPPPAYGSERGSILLERAGGTSAAALEAAVARQDRTAETPGGTSQRTLHPALPLNSNRQRDSRGPSSRSHRNRHRLPPLSSTSATATNAAGAAVALGSPTTSSLPIRPSPLRHSRAASNLSSRSSLSIRSNNGVGGEDGRGHADGVNEEDEAEMRNPPTPGLLDISLHSLHRFPVPDAFEEAQGENGSDQIDGERERLLRNGTNAQRSTIAAIDEISSHSGSTESRSRSRSRSGSGSNSSTEEEPSGGSPANLGLAVYNVPTTGTGLNISPPAYHPIDPNMYADGVVEAILEDTFSTLASRQFPHAHGIPSSQLRNQSGFASYEARGAASSHSPDESSRNSHSQSGGSGVRDWVDWLRGRSGEEGNSNRGSSQSRS